MERTYTTQEAAEVLRVSVWTIRRYIRDGKLKAVQLGHPPRAHYRLTAQALRAFLGQPT